VIDDDRHVSTIRIDRALWTLARSEARRLGLSLNKWVCEAMRQRLERDVLRRD